MRWSHVCYFIVAMVLWGGLAHGQGLDAQFPGCPQWVSRPQGLMCLCPNGAYASLNNGRVLCPHSEPPSPQPTSGFPEVCERGAREQRLAGAALTAFLMKCSRDIASGQPTPSVCRSKSQDDCVALTSDCSWIPESVSASGAPRHAYCRSKPRSKNELISPETAPHTVREMARVCNAEYSEIFCNAFTACLWERDQFTGGVLTRKGYCRARPASSDTGSVAQSPPVARPVLTVIPLLGVSVDDNLVVRRIDDPKSDLKQLNLALNPKIHIPGITTPAQLNDHIRGYVDHRRRNIELIFPNYPPGYNTTMTVSLPQRVEASAATAAGTALTLTAIVSVLSTLLIAGAAMAYKAGTLQTYIPSSWKATNAHEPRWLDRFLAALPDRLVNFRFDDIRLWLVQKLDPATHRAPTSVAPPVRPGPPPIPGTGAQANPPLVRDTAAAVRALRMAKSFLDETDGLANNKDAYPKARATLALAAKQLDTAARADPDAVLVLDDERTLSQPLLRADVLTQEAIFAETAARSIQYAEQATKADPTYALGFYILGLYHTEERHKPQAIAAFGQALALDPDNIEYQKYLMRAEAITASEVATYHATRLATGTVQAGIKTWKVLKVLAWLAGVALFLTPFYLISSCMRAQDIAQGRNPDNTPGMFSILFIVLLFGFALKMWHRIRSWWDKQGF